MAIRGVTDSRANKLPVIGYLKKGEPRGEKGIGKDMDCFRFVSEDVQVSEKFADLYGQRPKEIGFRLPYNDIDSNFATWQEEWDANGLVHRCDGETVVIWRDKNGAYRREACPCPYKELPSRKRGCKPRGRLFMLLPKLLDAGFYGVVVFVTSAWTDVRNIYNVLAHIYDVKGGLYGVEMVLYRRSGHVSTIVNGRKKTYHKSLVHVRPSASALAEVWARHEESRGNRGVTLPMRDDPQGKIVADAYPDAFDADEDEGSDSDDAWGVFTEDDAAQRDKPLSAEHADAAPRSGGKGVDLPPNFFEKMSGMGLTVAEAKLYLRDAKDTDDPIEYVKKRRLLETSSYLWAKNPSCTGALARLMKRLNIDAGLARERLGLEEKQRLSDAGYDFIETCARVAGLSRATLGAILVKRNVPKGASLDYGDVVELILADIEAKAKELPDDIENGGWGDEDDAEG